MALLGHAFTLATLTCALVSLCSGECSRALQQQRLDCMSHDNLEAGAALKNVNRTGVPDYTEFCKIIRKVTSCMIRATDHCTTDAKRLVDTKGFVAYNSAPYYCGVKDRNENLYRKCMGALLAPCQVHVDKIDSLVEEDERGGRGLYTQTCPTVRAYKRCFDGVSDGCNADIMARFKATVKPFMNYTTFDCFPGETEPVGTCRDDIRSLTCLQRYSVELSDGFTRDQSRGGKYYSTCRVVQRLHDCIAIKSSGCSEEIVASDMKGIASTAKAYNCVIDGCSKLWKGCRKLYDNAITEASAATKCQEVKPLAACARFATRNGCLPVVTRDVINYFKKYVTCKLKPVIEYCNLAEIVRCMTQFRAISLTLNPADPKACSLVRTFFKCANPMVVSTCPEKMKFLHTTLVKKYEALPWSCDTNCETENLEKCRTRYMPRIVQSARTEGKTGEYPETCASASVYRECVAGPSETCKPTSLASVKQSLAEYDYKSKYHCHGKHWCDRDRVVKCTQESDAKMKANTRNWEVFCGHARDYLDCLRPLTKTCPDVVEHRYQNFTAMYRGTCMVVTQPLTTTPACVGTCGSSSIAALPVVIAMATVLALLARK